MSYDEKLDARIAEVITAWGTTRKKMFGGTCHLINGNMMCGVYKGDLILRLGKAQAETALKQRHVKPFDITGKAMTGWVMVEAEGFKGKKLGQWLDMARVFAESLPPKR